MSNEKIKCKFNCPKCHTHWANAVIEFEKPLDTKSIIIIAGKKKKPKPGDSLVCSVCGYEYTNWDVHISILEGMQNEKTNTQKNKNTQQSETGNTEIGM